MKEVLSAEAMQGADRYTIEVMEVPSAVLMEKAALAATDKICSLLSPEEGTVLVVCGNGNNGGDGIAVARLLSQRGYRAEILLAMGEEKLSVECERQLRIARHYQIPEIHAEEDWGNISCLVDALFGIGLSRPITGKLLELVNRMNETRALKVAVDIPSGVHALTGKILGCAFKAQETITFAYGKIGQFLYPGRGYMGNLTVADIGIYRREGETEGTSLGLLEEGDISWIFHRDPEGNKGTFGKVLCVCGSHGMAGAARLCALSCLRTGAGMVKVVTVPDNLLALQIGVPEAMVDDSEREEEWERDLAWCDALILGPGLGRDEATHAKTEFFLKRAKERDLPVVIDADGLYHLAEDPGLAALLTPKCVLTPHVGEMARLLKVPVGEVKGDLLESAKRCAKAYGCTAVLKDASTVIYFPEGEGYVHPGGNPSLATAGSGDVLAGILGAVLVLGRKESRSVPFMAACGVYLHGYLGERAAKISYQGRILAGDIPEQMKYI